MITSIAIEGRFVPKRLAARLRAIYRKVASARDKIAYVEAKSVDVLLELDEFEADPKKYAELHYPLSPDPLAYPTVTRTERLKGWLDDKAPKMPGYHEELLMVEEQMDITEADVLGELNRIKQNTPGREPWPMRPSTLQSHREQWKREFSKQRKVGSNYRQQRLEGRRQAAATREAERKKFIDEMSERVRLKAATMSPGKAAAYISIMDVLQERIFGGDISLIDFYDFAQGRSSLMRDAIAEAESRAVARLASRNE